MISLENSAFFLRIDPGRNLFSVEPRQKNAPVLNDAHYSVRYRRGHAWHLQDDVLPAEIGEQVEVESLHGELRTRTIRFGPNRHGLWFELTFALPRSLPFLLWRMVIKNPGEHAVELGRIEVLRAGFASVSRAAPRRQESEYPLGDYTFPLKGSLPSFFSNGWGSWNHTGAFSFQDRFQTTRFGWFNGPMRVNPGTPQPRTPGHFASDMFAVLGDRVHRGGLLLGFLSQIEHFGSVEVLTNPLTPALSLWANGDETRLEPGGAVQTDWACLQPVQLDAPDPLGPYLEAVGRESGVVKKAALATPIGWCSWYQYFQEISAEIIKENIEQARLLAPEIGLELVQIDDGWQAHIGDWKSFSPDFPDGVSGLAREIRANEMTPGLWLAPFIVHPKSDLAERHPEWLLRNALRLPVNAGFVWNAFNKALDISQPEALAYAVEVVRRAAKDWGYPYLKLDFLYAGALRGERFDKSRSRARILRTAFEKIRAAAGEDVFLLACGSPLGPAIGLFDAMRINADVAPHWFPRFMKHERLFRHEPDFPATRNAVQNALTRAPMHRRWWVNDPDCLLVRPDSDLTLAEVRSLAAVIGLTGGSLLLSDDLKRLPQDRLRIAKQLIPPAVERPLVLDWFDEATPGKVRLDLSGPAGSWHVLARFNWSDRPADLVIDLREYHLDPEKKYIGREFWSGKVEVCENGRLRYEEVEPHGCVLVAVRQLLEGPQYVGSALHFTQGAELKTWEASRNRVRFVLESTGKISGQVVLRLPGEPRNIDFSKIGLGMFSLPVTVDRRLRLQVDFL